MRASKIEHRAKKRGCLSDDFVDVFAPWAGFDAGIDPGGGEGDFFPFAPARSVGCP
jgi:hypothetical protein